MTNHRRAYARELLDRARDVTQNWSMTIEGQFVQPQSAQTYDTHDPSTGELLESVSFAGPADVDSAVAAGKRAFPDWKKRHVDERAAILRQFANAVRAQAEEFGMLDALDSGNPFHSMVDDVKKACGTVEYFASLGMEIKGQTIPTPGGGLNYTRREPFGVTGRILPFNHPIMFAVGKIASALITGNTVVMKLPDQAPLSGLYLGRIVQDIFPPGVVNILAGDGATTGSHLVRHPDIYRIAFTGSVETGRRISEQAGICQLSLELGGKNPLIIFPDVDVDKAAEAAVSGMNYTLSQGQSCGSNSRVFVHKSLKKPFLKAVKQRVESIRIGHAVDDETQMGPVVSKAHYDRVMGYIAKGKEEGGSVLTGGGHVTGAEFASGYFIQPTVFFDVTSDMTIAREEIFGPVMSVIDWDDESRMLEEVNDSPYGLCANIWTNDISKALQMADDVEVGYVWVNGLGGKRFKGAPFGGVKNSGLGREHSIDEMLSFTQEKNVNVRY